MAKVSCFVFTFYTIFGFVLSNILPPAMTKRTALNESYKGLVESFSIPAEIHERDGKKYASFGSSVPIHVCTPEEVAKFVNSTHHYCDIFSEQMMASLGELAYVRLDENMAEKVFINRSKRILLVSSDGVLAQWRCAPSFESANQFVAGTPIANKDGELVSLVTAKRGNHYAVSNFEGEGGYFETTQPWEIKDLPEHGIVYGDRIFESRNELRSYIESLPPITVSEDQKPRPILYRGRAPRLVLVAQNGRQLVHTYLQGVATTNIDYL
ncbi:hypothetical protein K1T71_011552 [Dendrolimus kikuchii]|uniref:Uncharacterized protein n=1 Tax=Dendrolimus kikuchii TaxID=765133 RepID=A0ACC1CPJ4_9NEOP|nr:hypothetical protein K1T71_011552 [Dendrolimus kikuchii]